jgi:hypothetical protein
MTCPLDPLSKRIGWLDRKLRIVNENTTTHEDWLHWTKMAYKGTLGFEWQGDNLLLARENLLMSLFDYHEDRFGEEPAIEQVKEIADIISWNIFQMDGLKFVIPRSCHTRVEETKDLMTGEVNRKEIPCLGCKKGLIHNTHQDDLAYFIAGLILVKTGAMYGLNSQFPASN